MLFSDAVSPPVSLVCVVGERRRVDSEKSCVTRHFDHLRFGERPRPLDLDRDGLERPARRE
jgi:hypothetical protein